MLPSDGYFEIWTRATDTNRNMQPHRPGSESAGLRWQCHAPCRGAGCLPHVQKTHGGRHCAGRRIPRDGCVAQQFVPLDENPEDFPAGAGRDDTFYSCTACHGFKLIAQQGMSRRQWEESIELMVRRHNMPPLADKDQKTVLDYLEATFPPKAPAAGRGWQNPFSPR